MPERTASLHLYYDLAQAVPVRHQFPDIKCSPVPESIIQCPFECFSGCMANLFYSYQYLLPGLLLGLIIFGCVMIIYMLFRHFSKRKVEKELLMRAEIRGEYEDKRREKISKSLKERNIKKKEAMAEPKPVVAEQYLKEEEKQIVNVLKQREGSCEQGTLRVVTGMPKSTLSRILTELEQRSIIYKEKRGKKNIVFLRQ